MSQPRPVFHPITPPAEVSDAELADFARSKGVGTMIKSTTQAPAIAPQIAQDAPNDATRGTPTGPSSRKGSTAKKTAPEPGTPETDLKLSVMVPRYVGKALRVRAADKDCTVRHLVLQGLQAIGIPVKDADLNPDARLHRKDAL